MTKPFYDIFLSHAYEDQNEFAGQLALALKKKGLKVWYSGLELKLGASITASVNDALKKSRYGVVIISPVYLTKKWAMKELEALLITETWVHRILPVLHGISVEKLREKMPLLSDKYAVSSRRGINYVLEKILGMISKENTSSGASRKESNYARKKREKISIQNAGVIVLGGKADVKIPLAKKPAAKKTRK